MTRRFILAAIAVLTLCGVCGLFGAITLWPRLRPQPSEKNEFIFQGIHYLRDARVTPRPLVLHVITIDLREPGISFLVTPGDPTEALPSQARTTSKFLDEFNLQVAVNGDGFSPWYDNGFFSYYPRSSDRVDPLGFAASTGEIYSQNTDAEPVLYLAPANRARFNSPPGKIYNAISGNQMLVTKGTVAAENGGDPQPRTAIGLDRNARKLIIVVVDGRLPGYSEGVTLSELAQILVEFGAYNAMNLDGGGSSTLVKQGALGRPTLLNTPVHSQIPNRQRPIANHLGVYASPSSAN